MLSHYNHDKDDDGQERSSLTLFPNYNCRCYNTTSMQVLMITTKGWNVFPNLPDLLVKKSTNQKLEFFATVAMAPPPLLLVVVA
jgi:hypothetical protein